MIHDTLPDLLVCCMQCLCHTYAELTNSTLAKMTKANYDRNQVASGLDVA